MRNPTSFTSTPSDRPGSSNSRCHCGAEKFEAMLELGVANSRMKDFYDLQVLSSRLAFERHAAPLYARILRRHKQEKTVDGVLRKECNLHGKDGIRHRHRNTEDLFPSRLWQLCARELCSHYSGSPRCLARNKCTQNRAKTWLPVLRAGTLRLTAPTIRRWDWMRVLSHHYFIISFFYGALTSSLVDTRSSVG